MRRYWEEEGYEELDRLSADEKKRLEYETRLKYKRDKYAQLHYATRIGREEGERIGREEGQNEMIRSMSVSYTHLTLPTTPYV